MPSANPPDPAGERVPLLANYVLCAAAGTLWYLQFFFYGMGTTKMGRYDFSSWTLHMASIIIFGTLLGVYLSEWKGVGRRTLWLMRLGLMVLVSSTVIIGYGNYLAREKVPAAAGADEARPANLASQRHVTFPWLADPVIPPAPAPKATPFIARATRVWPPP
jgi:hypothetical protein